MKLREWESDARFPRAGIGWALYLLENHLDGIADDVPTRYLYRQEKPRCFAPYLTMVISPHGDVYPCCHLFEDNEGYWPKVQEDRRAYRIASTRDRPLAEIWRDSFVRFRQLAREIPWNNADAACGRCSRYAPHNVPLSRLFLVWAEACAALGNERADSVLTGLAEAVEAPDIFI